jgi:hypothetical protein
MPTTNSHKLTLTRDVASGKFKLTVTYNAEFNSIERFLSGLGMKFIERIEAIGVDPAGSTTGTVLGRFGGQFITVPTGVGLHSVPRKREILLSRAELDEDQVPFVGPDVDADEIRCRIRIEAVGLPAAVTPDAFTDQQVLGGLISFPVATAAQA